MFSKKNILKDLPLLQEQGLIDEATGQKLKDFYSKEEQAAEKLSPLGIVKALSLYLVGAIFAIIGGYMFIDYNWSFFSDFFKAVLMFSPLVASVPLIFYARKKPSILVDCIAIAVNFIGLVLALLAPSVIFNASGSILAFFTALVCLSCPILAIFKQPLGLILGAILLLCLKPAIISNFPAEYFSFSSFAYVLFFSIFLYQALSVKEKLSYEFVAKIFTYFLLSISLVITDSSRDSCESLFIIAFALCAFAVYSKREVLFLLSMTLFGFLACCLSSFRGLRRGDYDYIFEYDFFLLLLAIIVAIFGIVSLALAIYKKRSVISVAISGFLLLHILVFMLLPYVKFVDFNLLAVTKIWCNIAVLVVFALLFARGIRAKSLLFLNEAFALIMLYALFKLDDDYWTLAARSALFFGIGITMIVSNKILNRKIKQNEAK